MVQPETPQPKGQPAKKKQAQKRKPPLTVILVLVLLAAAALVYFYPDISDLISRWQTGRELAQFNQLVEGEKADYSDMWAAAEEYNQYLTTKESQFAVDSDERERIGGLLNPSGNHMMGTISIPKINVELPIWQGTEEKQLQSGAGWLFGSSLPTGGENTHCVITAHNGLVKAKLFTDLDQLEIGDTFTLTVLDRTMTYEVEAINVTLPEDFSLLAVQPGRDLVTLYTCTPYGVNTHRLLVTGHRIDTPETAEDTAAAIPLWLKLVLALAALLALLELLALLLLLLRRKKKKTKPDKTDTERENNAERRRGDHGPDNPTTAP